MADKRQIYRVILQLMTYISVVALFWVMFNSVFIADEEEKVLPVNIEMPLKQLKKGELTQLWWQSKKVSILHRNDVSDNLYLVYYDLGDSGNCPLFFNGKILKDTCTGTQYDQTGKPIKRSRADDLQSPPHYFIVDQNKVIIGTSK